LHEHATLEQRWPVVAEGVQKLQGLTLPVFQKEWLESKQKGYRPKDHPEGLHLQGSWQVLYVWEHSTCKQDRFPESCAALKDFDKALRSQNLGHVQEARFSTLYPRTKVATHTATSNQRLKVHCGIENPGGVQLRIANLTYEWQAGECIVLDDSFEHDIASSGSQKARTILEIKVEHPDLRRSGYALDEETGRLGRFNPARRRDAEL